MEIPFVAAPVRQDRRFIVPAPASLGFPPEAGDPRSLLREGPPKRRSCLTGVLTIMAFSFLVSCGSDDPAAPTPPPPTPVISALSDSVLAPGDTLTVTGRDFSTVANANRVVFNNDLAEAIPFFATGDSLRVVVPVWANSGGLFVRSQGVSSTTTKTVEIQRGVGEPWAIRRGAVFDFKLPAPAGTEEYVLIPYSASAGAQDNFAYTVTPSGAATFPAPPRSRTTRASGEKTFAMEFELDIRRQAIEYIRAFGGGKRPFEEITAPQAPPARVPFQVLNCAGSCSTGDPANYTTVNADLKFSGRRALIYADVNQPTGSFTQADYDAFGMQFDNQIFPTDSMFFGPPSDIDGNGRVAILFTPQVNLLTPAGTAQSQGFISGFFLFNDLAPAIFPQTSNGMEIFYAMVPDPNNEFGNTFTKTQVTTIVPGTLAHEFEHMISFGFRFFNFGINALQNTWLEEGMAHMAEDLNGFDTSNTSRVNRYLQNIAGIAGPGDVSLLGSDTLEQRGGIFLFLRYLGDQLGDGIYKSILQNACLGTACVQNVTGVDFFTSLADFLATLYLSGRGITANPKYNYSSLNLQQPPFAPLLVAPRTVAAGAFAGDVRNAGGDFYSISGFQSPAVQFDFAGAANGQVRVIAVRTQ